MAETRRAKLFENGASQGLLVTYNTRHFEMVKLPLMLENWMK